MMPIGPLMVEHRLVERMVAVMRSENAQAEASGRLTEGFVDTLLDFGRTYVESMHHGKEEQILFAGLAAKSLTPADRRLMEELMAEHRYAREVKEELASHWAHYQEGQAEVLGAIAGCIDALAGFYPRHIQKEDEVFFPAAMRYLSAQEQADMLSRFYELDSRVFHEEYRRLVSRFES